MHKEYRRYLLKKEVSAIVEDLQTKFSTSNIFFTKIKLCKEIRYDHTDNIYRKIVQSGTQHTQSVTFKRIGKKKYHQKKRDKQGVLLNLYTYLLKIDNCTMHIEVYERKLKGLYILTVPNNCIPFMEAHAIQNSFIGKFIEADVSDDPRYEQKYLALFGNPTKHPYNIYAIFKDLEQKRLHNPYEIIFKEMKNADAVRIYLYKRYLILEEYTKKVQMAKAPYNEEIIEKFRNEVKRIISIIKSYEEIFDEQQYRKILLHMMTLLNITKTHADLILIASNIAKLSKKLHSPYIKEILENIRRKTALETHKIGNYFGSREFQIISSQLKRFIREKNNSYTNYESQLPFGYSAKIKVFTKHGELLQTINFLDGCNDEKSYEKLQTTFEELIEFITIFVQHIDSKPYVPLLQKTQQIYKLLEKQAHRDKYLLIIKMLLNYMNDKEHPEEIAYLDKKKKNFLQKKRKFDKNIFKHLEKFKDTTF